MHDWRMHKREQYRSTIDMSVTILTAGRLEMASFKAETIDISRGGVGIATLFCLEPGFVKIAGIAGFDAGIVVWTKRAEQGVCRAGIRFVRTFTKQMREWYPGGADRGSEELYVLSTDHEVRNIG